MIIKIVKNSVFGDPRKGAQNGLPDGPEPGAQKWPKNDNFVLC